MYSAQVGVYVLVEYNLLKCISVPVKKDRASLNRNEHKMVELGTKYAHNFIRYPAHARNHKEQDILKLVPLFLLWHLRACSLLFVAQLTAVLSVT